MGKLIKSRKYLLFGTDFPLNKYIITQDVHNY